MVRVRVGLERVMLGEEKAVAMRRFVVSWSLCVACSVAGCCCSFTQVQTRIGLNEQGPGKAGKIRPQVHKTLDGARGTLLYKRKHLYVPGTQEPGTQELCNMVDDMMLLTIGVHHTQRYEQP